VLRVASRSWARTRARACRRVRRLHRVAHAAVGAELEPLLGDRRPARIAAELLEPLPIARRDGAGGVHVEAEHDSQVTFTRSASVSGLPSEYVFVGGQRLDWTPAGLRSRNACERRLNCNRPST
jgi:hypothetical protein